MLPNRAGWLAWDWLTPPCGALTTRGARGVTTRHFADFLSEMARAYPLLIFHSFRSFRSHTERFEGIDGDDGSSV